MKYTTLKKLQDDFKHDSDISYNQLLLTIEWQKKRLEILVRDNFRCVHCHKPGIRGLEEILNEYHKYFGELSINKGVTTFKFKSGDKKIYIISEKPSNTDKANLFSILHVHHKLYIDKNYPWSYHNNDLETVCHDCHHEIHSKSSIPVYNRDGFLVDDRTYCDRCDGKGYIRAYNHVQGGICFKCRGKRYYLTNKDSSISTVKYLTSTDKIIKSDYKDYYKISKSSVAQAICMFNSCTEPYSKTDGVSHTSILGFGFDIIDLKSKEIIFTANFEIADLIEDSAKKGYLLLQSSSFVEFVTDDLYILISRFYLDQGRSEYGGPEGYVINKYNKKTRSIVGKPSFSKFPIYSTQTVIPGKLIIGRSSRGSILLNLETMEIHHVEEFTGHQYRYLDKDLISTVNIDRIGNIKFYKYKLKEDKIEVETIDNINYNFAWYSTKPKQFLDLVYGIDEVNKNMYIYEAKKNIVKLYDLSMINSSFAPSSILLHLRTTYYVTLRTVKLMININQNNYSIVELSEFNHIDKIKYYNGLIVSPNDLVSITNSGEIEISSK